MKRYLITLLVGVGIGAYIAWLSISPTVETKIATKTEVVEVEKLVTRDVVKTRWLKPDGSVVEQEHVKDTSSQKDVSKKEQKTDMSRQPAPTAYELGVMRSVVGKEPSWSVLTGARLGRSPFYVISTISISPRPDVSVGMSFHF